MNRAILKIGRHEYEVLHMNYKFDRNIDRRGCPISRYYGGSIYVHIETTDDRLLFQTMFDEKMPTVDGSIEVYGFNDAVVRRIEFEGAYIYDLTEQMSVYSPWLPMLTTIGISPMRLTFNNRIAIDRRWPDYPQGWDPVKKEDVKYAQVKGIATEVSEIEMVTPLTKTPCCPRPGMDLDQRYKLRVKRYTNGQPQDLRRIRWEYAYTSNEGEVVTGVFHQQRGEEIEVVFDDPTVANVTVSFYAHISHPKEEGECRVYVNPLWQYKGTKQWGKLGSSELEMLAERRSFFDLCFDLDDSGKKRALQLSLMPESIVRLAYEYATGPRQVLSDNDNVEQRVIDNFYNGNGQKLSFGSTSVLSRKLHVNPTFQAYFKHYLNDFVKKAIEEGTIETVDGEGIRRLLALNKNSAMPNFSKITEIKGYDYYGLMGGTQRITVDLDIIQTNATHYMVKTRMYIGDWYGADIEDINGEYSLKGMIPSLSAFFWLQHHYGYQPFETEIVYDSVDVITIEKEAGK